MYLQYGELRPTNGWDLFTSLGHPSKFQRVSRLGFVTAATSFTGGQPNFARCLAVSWAGTLSIHFRGFCPLTEFCQVQTSLCVHVLHSRQLILAALLRGTRQVGVSQTLQRELRNWRRLGGYHVGHRPTFLFVYITLNPSTATCIGGGISRPTLATTPLAIAAVKVVCQGYVLA